MPYPSASHAREPRIGTGRSDRFGLDTDELPSPIRFDAWRAFWHPAVLVALPRGHAGDFRGRATLRRLGRHVLLEMDADPADYHRARGQGLRDGFDHWFVGLGFDADGQPSTLWLGSLASGFGLRRLGGRWLGVLVAPERLPQLAAVFAASRAVPLTSAPARMLAGMLPRMAASLDEVGPADAPRLEAALSSMLSACLLGWDLRPASTRAQLEAARRARVIGFVDRLLGDPELTPAELVRLAGISRSELYRCFAPAGGLARVIQLRRLRRAYAELARADGPASISRVAEAVGFFDPSNFTRAFRREFGCTPSEVIARRAAMSVQLAPGLVAALSAG